MKPYEIIALIEQNLRDLFKDKDRLVGLDDWDTLIGILLLLKKLREELEIKPEE